MGWILLTSLTSGFGFLAYILLWILVPAAESTSEKLKMTGEPINVSNISKKVEEDWTRVLPVLEEIVREPEASTVAPSV